MQQLVNIAFQRRQLTHYRRLAIMWFPKNFRVVATEAMHVHVKHRYYHNWNEHTQDDFSLKTFESLSNNTRKTYFDLKS